MSLLSLQTSENRLWLFRREDDYDLGRRDGLPGGFAAFLWDGDAFYAVANAVCDVARPAVGSDPE
jgi:hypothetical protein